jgi:hypothetical protein
VGIPASLLTAWKSQDKRISSLVDEYTTELGDLRKELIGVLRRLPRTADGLLSNEVTPEFVYQVLNATSWPEYVRGLDSLFTPEKVGNLAVDPENLLDVASSANAVRKALHLSHMELAKVHAKLSQQLLVVVQTMTVSNLQPSQVSSLIAASMPDGKLTKKQAQAAVETALSGLQGELQQEAGKLLGSRKKYWLYLGPEDRKNRDFCATFVGKALSDKEFKKLKNGTNLPAQQYGGGYRCRHTWLAVSERYVLQNNITVVDANGMKVTA